MITIAVLLIYTNQIESSQETATQVSSETFSFYTDLSILSVYTKDYVVQNQKNRRVVDTLSYGCYAGNEGEDEFSHIVSESEGLTFLPERFLERSLNSSIAGPYRFEMDCEPWNSSSKKIIIGEEIPENKDVVAKSVPVPLPEENLTQARLYRWYP